MLETKPSAAALDLALAIWNRPRRRRTMLRLCHSVAAEEAGASPLLIGSTRKRASVLYRTCATRGQLSARASGSIWRCRSPLQTDSVTDGLPGFGVSDGLRERNRLRLREAMRGANGTVLVCGVPLRGDMEPVASVIARRMSDANRLRLRLALPGQMKPSASSMPAFADRPHRRWTMRGALTRPLAVYADRPRRRWAREAGVRDRGCRTETTCY